MTTDVVGAPAAPATRSVSAVWRALARTCPVTGLVVNRDTDRLVRWNAVVGIVFLLVGTIAGWAAGDPGNPARHQ